MCQAGCRRLISPSNFSIVEASYVVALQLAKAWALYHYRNTGETIRAVASGGPVVSSPPFHVWLSSYCIHPILCLKMCPSAAKSWRRAWKPWLLECVTIVLDGRAGNKFLFLKTQSREELSKCLAKLKYSSLRKYFLL